MLISQNIASLDNEVLLAWAVSRDRTWILTYPEYELTHEQEKKFKDAIARRKKHEPIAYIIGEKKFYGMPFYVTRDVLIPRPETELLVDTAVEYLNTHNADVADVETRRCRVSLTKRRSTGASLQYVIDIGTGSGNIIISIAKNLNKTTYPLLRGVPSADGGVCYIATDISTAALAIAQKNHQRLCPDIPIQFIQSDLLSFLCNQTSPLRQLADSPSQGEGVVSPLILANLPYIPKPDTRKLKPDIRNYEPHSALFSGKDGLDHYRELIDQIKKIKQPEQTITLIAEIDPRQISALQCLLPNAKIIFDLTKRARIVIAKITD